MYDANPLTGRPSARKHMGAGVDDQSRARSHNGTTTATRPTLNDALPFGEGCARAAQSTSTSTRLDARARSLSPPTEKSRSASGRSSRANGRGKATPPLEDRAKSLLFAPSPAPVAPGAKMAFWNPCRRVSATRVNTERRGGKGRA